MRRTAFSTSRTKWIAGGRSRRANPDRWLKIFEGNAAEGNQYLNLDTTETHRDIAYQDLVTTEAGASYYVTFSMKTDGDQSVSADELRVRWNGAVGDDGVWHEYLGDLRRHGHRRFGRDPVDVFGARRIDR